jgi:hypothetical protein
LGAGMFLAVAAFFLWQEHAAHLLGVLPYALLLLCVITHVLMHRGHGDRAPVVDTHMTNEAHHEPRH